MKKIEDYWINELKEVEEFKQLARIENICVQQIENALNILIDDQFVETATVKGVSRREKMLNIVPDADDTLIERKKRVSVRWNEKLPYTYRVLEQQLNILLGSGNYKILLDHNAYLINIDIVHNAKKMLSEVNQLINRIIPANMLTEYTSERNIGGSIYHKGYIVKTRHLKIGKHLTVDIKLNSDIQNTAGSVKQIYKKIG